MANEKFKVKFGLAVGDTSATIDGTTGNIVTTGTLDVQGGTITESTGALSITTGAANGAITLDPNGTGNVVMTFANGGNLTNDRNYVSGIIRQTAAASAGDIWGFVTGTTNPYRGISIDNTASATTTTGKRTGIVMRNYSNAPRNSIIGEAARGTNPSAPTILTNANVITEMTASGYTAASDGTGFQATGCTIAGTTLTIGTVTAGAPAVGQLLTSVTQGAVVTAGTTITANISGSGSGSTWTVSNSQTVGSSTIWGGGDGWMTSVNGLAGAIRLVTGENWTNQTSGTNLVVALSPLANSSTLALAGATYNALTMNSSTTVFQSGQYSFQPSAFSNLSDGNMNFNVVNNRATSGNQIALINFTTQRSPTGSAPFSPTQANDFIGQFKFNGNSYTGNAGVPRGPCASISSSATENWSGFSATGSSISGTTLTIGTLAAGGLIAVGQSIYGTGVTIGTKILANISGSGSGSTWTVSPSQTVASTTITGGVNGGRFNFQAIKTGTLDSYDVIAGGADSLSFNSDTVNINNFNSTVNRVNINDFAATINLPVNLYEIGGVTPLVGNKISYNRVYGQWQYDATITPAAANTGYAIPFQGVNATIDFANVATASNTSEIRPNALGMYKMQFSAQVENSDNGQDHQITFWWRKNGVDITNSAGYFTVPKAGVANGSLIVGWDNMVQVTTVTDYFELIYAVNNTAVTLPYVAASAPRPGAAAVFLTLVPIGA